MTRQTLGSIAPRPAPMTAAEIVAPLRRARPLATWGAILAAFALAVTEGRAETSAVRPDSAPVVCRADMASAGTTWQSRAPGLEANRGPLAIGRG